MGNDKKQTRSREAAVGYGRPPVATQFKKGQSGNPRGRPPKAAGHRAIAARVLGEKQRLANQPKGVRVLFQALEIVVMTLKQVAAGGHAQAAALYMKVSDRFGRVDPEERKAGYLIVLERLTEEEWEALYAPKDDPPPFDQGPE